MFRDVKYHYSTKFDVGHFADYALTSHFSDEHFLSWTVGAHQVSIKDKKSFLNDELANSAENIIKASSDYDIEAWVTNTFSELAEKGQSFAQLRETELFKKAFEEFFRKKILADAFNKTIVHSKPEYIPSERTIVASLEYSWAGLMRDDIGLPRVLLDFANSFSLARKETSELDIPFLNVKYQHIDGRDFIKIPEREEPLMLLETASGIQSVTPMLVLLEHLSRNTEQAQSFIIEEPELNLYPTAQRDLVYTLLEKCTQGENDLTITTHSPYVLTALNIALYANKIATQYPHQKKKVEKILPAKYWLKPEDFSAYYVGGGGIKSIFDTKAGLIDENSLDSVSMELADVFNALTRLRKPKVMRK